MILILKGGEILMILEEKKNFIINFIYFLIWTLLVWLIFRLAAVYLLPFLIGLFIAYFVQRPAQFISEKVKIKKQICAAILSVTFYILIFSIIFLLIWAIYSQSNRFIRSVTNNGKFSDIFEKIFSFSSLNFKQFDLTHGNTARKIVDETINGFVEKISVYLSSVFTAFLKKIPSLFISSVITIVATCYIAKDFENLYKFFKGFVSDKYYKKFIEFKEIFFECFLKFSVGYFWLFLITFFELFFSFLFLRISNFAFLALLISFIDLLPIFGTGAILIPWATLEALQYNYPKAVGLIAVYLITILVRNLMEPKIIGKQIGINPLFTLFFIFLGLKIGGVIGMITLPIAFTVAFNYCRKQIKLYDEKI